MDTQILTEILENQKLMFNEIKDLKSEQQKTNQRLDNIESEQQKTNQRLNNIESDVSTLKSDVSTLKSDVSTLKSDVNVLKSDMSEVKYTLKAVFDQTVNLTEFRTENNMNFKEVKNVLKNHSYRIDKLESIS